MKPPPYDNEPGMSDGLLLICAVLLIAAIITATIWYANNTGVLRQPPHNM